LKNNLNNYPSDVTIFKEFVQTADDALASEIHFVFDFRPSGDEQVFPEWSRMRSWLGPCLWVYNDAVFTDDDFESIRAYGAGGKQTKAGKISRFGLGFCSCYNLTDVPHILSGSTCQILDPHRHALPGDGEAMDLNDKQNQQEIKDYPGLLKPFTTLRVKDVPALDLQRLPYQGTLFRLPFRTEETLVHAKDISKFTFDQQHAADLKKQFHQEARFASRYRSARRKRNKVCDARCPGLALRSNT